MTYPQHDKLKALDGANQTVGDFIGWLDQHGYTICERTIPGEYNEGQDFRPTLQTRENLLAAFFEIDERELSREKDRMLEDFRQRQSVKEAIE